jgi:hypothetical protein
VGTTARNSLANNRNGWPGRVSENFRDGLCELVFFDTFPFKYRQGQPVAPADTSRGAADTSRGVLVLLYSILRDYQKNGHFRLMSLFATELTAQHKNLCRTQHHIKKNCSSFVPVIVIIPSNSIEARIAFNTACSIEDPIRLLFVSLNNRQPATKSLSKRCSVVKWQGSVFFSKFTPPPKRSKVPQDDHIRPNLAADPSGINIGGGLL